MFLFHVILLRQKNCCATEHRIFQIMYALSKGYEKDYEFTNIGCTK